MADAKTIMEPEVRSAAIRSMMGRGMSRDDANIVIDMGVHAELQMLELVKRILDSAPPHLVVNVLSCALSRIIERAEHEERGMILWATAKGYEILRHGEHKS